MSYDEFRLAKLYEQIKHALPPAGVRPGKELTGMIQDALWLCGRIRFPHFTEGPFEYCDPETRCEGEQYETRRRPLTDEEQKLGARIAKVQAELEAILAPQNPAAPAWQTVPVETPAPPTNGKLYHLLPGHKIERDGREPVKLSQKQFNLLRLLETKNPLPVSDTHAKRPDAPWHGRYQHDRHFGKVQRAVNRITERLMDLNLEAKVSRDDGTIIIYPTDAPKNLDSK